MVSSTNLQPVLRHNFISFTHLSVRKVLFTAVYCNHPQKDKNRGKKKKKWKKAIFPSNQTPLFNSKTQDVSDCKRLPAYVDWLCSTWCIQGLLVNYKQCVRLYSHPTCQRLFAALEVHLICREKLSVCEDNKLVLVHRILEWVVIVFTYAYSSLTWISETDSGLASGALSLGLLGFSATFCDWKWQKNMMEMSILLLIYNLGNSMTTC